MIKATQDINNEILEKSFFGEKNGMIATGPIPDLPTELIMEKNQGFLFFS